MNRLKVHVYPLLLAGITLLSMNLAYAQSTTIDNAIQPYHENPWYWQYKGEPILLIGASDEDNLFQWTGEQLTDHLDLMESVGGNYVRNTMSDRDEGNLFAVREIEDGKYDLEQWNDEYWNRLEFFLDETEKRDIVVQLTLWDWFDLLYGRFPIHPLNPENNINWEPGTIEDTRDFYGGSLYENNESVLDFQHRYIDKLLSITLAYDHILYNINNESSIGAEWENYWATYLKEVADSSNKDIYITSMQLIPSNSLRHVMTNRDLYAFVDVSQNNQDAAGAVGHKHWENLIYWRNMIDAQQDGPMPINNIKVYGESVGNNVRAGTEKEAVERFWRNIFAGSASTRFHRPGIMSVEAGGWGIGLSDKAQHTLQTVTMFLDEFDIFNAEPYAGCKTIGPSIPADYCLANVGEAYAVYFPSGRSSVDIDPWVYLDEVTIKWLNVTRGEWVKEETKKLDWTKEVSSWWGPDRVLVLTPEDEESYIAIIKAK
ncbi:MAG: hypothetical protein U5K72_02495 [Balneolaceae bacterium]|nr:hypothetical protein [Balneolaceae bacterium]